MSSTKSKRWILAVLMATVLPALAFHASCVAVMGPGSWGSGVEEKLPEILPAGSNPQVLSYVEEFSAEPRETRQPVFPGDDSLLKGTICWVDHVDEPDLWVVQTFEGKSWVDQQHVYLWSGGSRKKPERLDITRDMVVERPVFMKREGKALLVYGHWNSWAIPPFEKLKRYLRSYLDSTLRPESSLCVHDFEARKQTYFGPGHTLLPSPDRRRALLLRSGALGAGYYSIHLWDLVRGRLETIISLREADQGSGRSFEYRWSNDSRAFHLTGVTGGFERRRLERRELNLIYLVDERAIYQVE